MGRGSVFVKRDLQILPLTDAEFEADFFLDRRFSTKRCEAWKGVVIEREFGAMLAMEDVPMPPPTVNDLATLLAHAMERPPEFEKNQRPRRLHLRNRPQWTELLPHLRQLQIEIVLSDDLPGFDEVAMEWLQEAGKKVSTEEIRNALRKPFPERKRSSFTDTIDLAEWSYAMLKGTCPSRHFPVSSYDPTTIISIPLTADELEAIPIKTEIAKTKKLRPRLEAMAAEGKAIELNIGDWSRVLLALCGARTEETAIHNHLLRIAQRITNQISDALGIAPPLLRKQARRRRGLP